MTIHADKKVVLLSGSLKLSGSTTWIINLHRGLRQLGVDVIHIVTNRPGQEILPDDLRVFYTGAMDKRLLVKLARAVRLHRLAPACYQALLDRLYNRAVAGILAQLGWQDSVDRVIKDFTAYLPPLLARYPLISTIHQKLSLNWHSARLRQHAREPAVFVAVSQHVQRDARQLGIDVRHVIYNPIDAQKIRRQAEVFTPDFVNFIVFVGTLDRAKGVYELLKAFSRLDQPLELVYVGSGAEQQGLYQQAAALGVADRVHFTGFVSNPYPYIQAARLLVLPSFNDVMGYCVVEAAMLGVPALVGDFDGAEEFYRPEIIVPRQPEADFAERLADAIETTLQHDVIPALIDEAALKMQPVSVAQAFCQLDSSEVVMSSL